MIPKVQLVIPMGGLGSRFTNAGFKTPKPMILVQGRPMIERVLGNFVSPLVKKVVLVTRDEVLDQDSEYKVREAFPTLDLDVIRLNGISQGPADSVRAASPALDSDLPLLVANSDQLILPSAEPFLLKCLEERATGHILTFQNHDPKWSYVALDQDGFISQVVEKRVISHLATVGIYYFPTVSGFLSAVSEMEAKGDRTNGELYVAPAFNYLGPIKSVSENVLDLGLEFFGLGTPEDLEDFITSRKLLDD